MTLRRLSSRPPPEITVALANEANAQLLGRLLDGQFSLRRGLDTLGRTSDTSLRPGLIIIDAPCLQQNHELIRSLRHQAAPIIVPVLLIVDSRTGPSPRITAELGRSVDDVLRVPTSQAELKARIDNLLRLAELSREQEEARRQLIAVISSLRTLNACDQVIVRSTTEEELVSALCRTIIHEEGYNLAWIGFQDETDSKPVEICTYAGPAAAGFVADLNRGWQTDPSKFGPVAKTLRNGQTHIVSDIANELPPSNLRDCALKHGLAAGITLALKADNGPRGCLAIYSDKVGTFGDEERQLLERLADKLVFGLNALRVHQERARQASEIHYMVYTDTLTGLPNRRHLIHYLDGVLADSSPKAHTSAILFLDLDGFKLINDALGHKVGDQVLKQVAQRLLGSVRDRDLVVRQGGDEFLVVMIDDSRQGTPQGVGDVINSARTLATRIIQRLAEPLTAGGFAHRLKASVGISLWPDHGRDAVELIENADKAMYEAKKLGGGRSFLFSPDISVSRQERFSLESRLRLALDQQQFALHYQPIFELESCRIVAVEALIRWPQEDGTVMMPGAFMPLVEETGLINPLGDWVLETAARQLRSWHDQGFTLAMAVNLSINQLYPEADAEHFAALVRPHVDPLWIHLEVTENALMADPAAIEKMFADLHRKGFQLAIDDFGTGYSSLSRLQHLSIQSLKIDRSFVSELGTGNSKGASLVPIIQQMAGNLKLLTVAEGIETEAQRQALLKTSTGLAWGQGYWFSRPVPPEQVESLLQAEPEQQ